ncbi:MAG: hypothetical protein AAGE92_07030 [Cyanobacteria bacterium P01_G01_bin.4]
MYGATSWLSAATFFPCDMTLANCSSIAQYLAACNSQKFTGTLSVSSAEGTVWNLRFFIGRLIAEAGGVAPIARWRRHLLRVVPKLDWHHCTSALDLDKLRLEWNTKLLEDLLKRDRLDRRQARSILQGCAIDVLFDIALEEERASANRTPAPSVTSIPCSQLGGDKSFMIPLNAEEIWELTASRLEQWVDSTGKYLSPNLVPKIVQPSLLEKLVSPDIWQLFSQLMDGNHSLRDVSEVLGKTVDMVYLSLCPFIFAEAIELGAEVDIVTELNLDTPRIHPTQTDTLSNTESDDATAVPSVAPEASASSETPIEPPTESHFSSQQPSGTIARIPDTDPSHNRNNSPSNHSADGNPAHGLDTPTTVDDTSPLNVEFAQNPQPKIAYIDSSSVDRERMQSVLSILGFTQISHIQEPTLAIAALLDSPPDLVFLGLTDAYDICLRIRRLSPLKHIPVTIVGHSDGVLERFRAKLAGAYGLVSKPIAEEDVARILHRYYSTPIAMNSPSPSLSTPH